MRILAFIFALSMLLSMAAFAAQESSAYIAATNGYITFSGNDVNEKSEFREKHSELIEYYQ